MNVLFLTLTGFYSLKEHNIYTDLLREFYKNGHNVYIISPVEKRKNEKTHVIKEKKGTILKLRIGNVQKTNVIEKGISTVTLESKFVAGIKKHFNNIKFDLVLYSTPPITLQKAVAFVKKRDGAKTYLLLKDIFPQNAVDIGMLRKSGIKGILYRYFRMKEKQLYTLSDHIGCMSPANVEYVLKHNPEIEKSKVEVCPNSIEPIEIVKSEETRIFIRNKYGVPLDKTVFLYGGNLGKPQGIDFLIECLKKCEEYKEAFFLILGSGTEYGKLEDYINANNPPNVKLMSGLPKEDYDCVVESCDVGMIFLDYRFTIPNFPSRLLSYMQAGIPILACTDPNTDIGKVIVEGGFGWWCESDDLNGFSEMVKKCFSSDLLTMGSKGFKYLNEEYSIHRSYEIIMERLIISR